MYGYIIFILSMAAALICMSYSQMARASGWPVGEILSKETSLPKIAAFITLLWVIGKSFMVFQWWSPLIIIVIGWIVAFVLTRVLRENVQFIGIIGIFPMLLMTVLYTSETKPLGMLSNLLS